MERIALFGGSFDPPHDGHMHIAEAARRELRADKVLWMITPISPHKTDTPPAPYRERFIESVRLTRHVPFIHVTDIERRIASRCTFDTITHFVQKKDPYRRYVWIAGSDVIPAFHRWKHVDAFLKQMPFAFFSRGDNAFTRAEVRDSPLFRSHARYIRTHNHPSIFTRSAPALHAVTIPTHPASSTALRDMRASS